MNKKCVVAAACACVVTSLFARVDNEPSRLEYRVPVTRNWVYYSPETPTLQVVVKNNNANLQSPVSVVLEVSTDQHTKLLSMAQQVNLPGGDSLQLNFTFSVPEPGFYRCRLIEKEGSEQRDIKAFNIGYEPTAIVSLPDAQPDLKTFWDEAKAELKDVDPEFRMTIISDSCNKVRKLYIVTMKSLGGEEISGYYSTPAKKGKYPVVISYMGYGSKPWIPGGNSEYSEFVLSVRGQALNEPNNKFGDWITYGLEAKEQYYYRGAFMDLIRAIDFVTSRPEVDTNCIFAEGGSQGGAFTLAACALDDRIRAAAPYIPFLSDYTDYFKIVHWPAQPIFNKQRELGLSDAYLYELLSYFDIKNLAGWIKCPVIMSVGLQDEVCPPHTNFAGYNRISSEKEYYVYPEVGHDVPTEWWSIRNEFFKRFFS